MVNFNSKLLVIARGYLKRRFAKLLVTKRWWILGFATNCKNNFPQQKRTKKHGRHVSKKYFGTLVCASSKKWESMILLGSF